LQAQMDSVNMNLRSAEDRKILLQTQSSRLRTLQPGISGSAGQAETPSTLDGLRQELQRLQSRYSDKHPDVVRIKRLIAKAETGEQVGGGQAGLGEATDSSRTTDAQRLISVQTEDIATQKNVIAKEILALRQERQKIGLQIEDYHHRIESGPKTEQMFLDLRRDYQQASENYQTLLQKKLQAELAANLERTHKGGQFTILDPANWPRTAYKPDLKKILPMALMAALACGFGLGFLREYMDRAFWSRKELEGVLGIPVLATVPFIHTQRDLQKRKVRLAGTIFALCVMGSTLLIGLIILWHISFGPVPS